MTPRTVMDGTDYDKIVDKLLVFRGKIPVDGTLSDKAAQFYANRLRYQIDELLECIDWFADLQTRGLIK